MPKVIYDSTKNKDMFYIVRMDIMDPFFLIDTDSKKYIFLDHREFGVFKEKNKNKDVEVVLLDSVEKDAEKMKEGDNELHNLAWYLFQKYGLADKKIEVPQNFPFPLVDFLRSKGVVFIPKTPLYPERAIKTPEEISAMRESIRKTEKAFALIEKILRGASTRGDRIFYQGEILTSEFLKKEVEQLLLKEDMVSEEGMIISSWLQTAIPHHTGEGSIKANQPIVCDIFPCNRKTGYFADITRTFLKGKPSYALQKMYGAVLQAQQETMKTVKAGMKASKIHGACARILLDLGYDVGDEGFVHKTGHGVGLEIHEEPFLRENSLSELQPGNIITIEPGLYYPNVGGVRIEDDILVTQEGYENLTSYSKEWIIP